MLLGFKTQLKVNKQQRPLLAQHAGVARHAWNQGLALCQQVLLHNKLQPEDKIKFPTAIDLHKITTYISKNHAVIGIEDLNVSGMLANGKLSKAIADMGFYQFR
ncbi:MAG: helix-turn-helix domain-containing protein, partial [Sphaerospermopsis kisseleviana]